MEVCFREGRLKSADGLELRTRHWSPAKSGQPDVCLIHGWGDCSERLRHVAEAFARAGFGGVFYDLRGHGTSDGRRGDFKSYGLMLSDLGAVLDSLPGAQRGRVIVAGFSFGGQLTVNLLASTPSRPVLGVALIAPWLKLRVRAPAYKLAIAYVARVILPGHVQKTPVVREHLSSDTAWLDELEARAVGGNHSLISARAYFFALENGLHAVDCAGRPGLFGGAPLFTAHGTDDLVTDPVSTAEFHARYSGADRLHCEYGGWRHELQNEIGRRRFLTDLIDWAVRVGERSEAAQS